MVKAVSPRGTWGIDRADFFSLGILSLALQGSLLDLARLQLYCPRPNKYLFQEATWVPFSAPRYASKCFLLMFLYPSRWPYWTAPKMTLCLLSLSCGSYLDRSCDSQFSSRVSYSSDGSVEVINSFLANKSYMEMIYIITINDTLYKILITVVLKIK